MYYALKIKELFIVRMNKKVKLAASLLCMIIMTKSYAVSATYDLNDCIRVGIANSYSIKKQLNNIKYYEIQTLSSYGSFLPSLEAGLNYYPYSRLYQNNINIQEGIPGGALAAVSHDTKTESKDANYYIKGRLELFDGFGNYNKIRSAINEENGNRLLLGREKEKVIYDIIKKYYQLMLDYELLKIAEENYVLSENNLKKISARVLLGDLSKSDQYQQETKVYENRLLCIKRKNEIVIDKVNIMNSMGILGTEQDADFKVIKAGVKENNVYPDKDLMLEEAVKSRGDYLGKERLVSASKYNVEVAKSGIYPNISLVVQVNKISSHKNLYNDNGVEYQLQEQKSVTDDLFKDVGVFYGLEMKWNIFDGFERGKNIQKSKKEYLNAMLEKEEIRDGIIMEIQKYVSEYETAKGRMAAADASVKSAIQAYSVVYERYNNGFADFAELSESNTSMLTAKSERAQAVYNLEYLEKVIKYYTGTMNLDEYLLSEKNAY